MAQEEAQRLSEPLLHTSEAAEQQQASAAGSHAATTQASSGKQQTLQMLHVLDLHYTDILKAST